MSRLQQHTESQDTITIPHSRPNSTSPTQHFRLALEVSTEKFRRPDGNRSEGAAISPADEGNSSRRDRGFAKNHDVIFIEEDSPGKMAGKLMGWNEWTVKELKEGLTNQLYLVEKVSANDDKRANSKVLVRVYGRKTEGLIDREREINNLRYLAANGLAPPLYARFQNGFIYGFVPGDVFSVQDMRDPKNSLLVAHTMTRWHRLPLQPNQTPMLFPTIRRWLLSVSPGALKPDDQLVFKDNFDMDILHKEIDIIQRKLAKLQSPAVFCHCDLLAGNIILQRQRADTTAVFIDYEYGCCNYRGFDIANHLVEWGGFQCEWKYVLDRTQMLPWLTEYWISLKGVHPSTEQLDQLSAEVQKFKLAAHFFWGVWALVQASNSEIDFNYMNYSVLRFKEYWKRKDEYLSI